MNYDWAFADAPRWLRLEAVPHIPALLVAIAEQADKFAKQLEATTATVRSISI